MGNISWTRKNKKVKKSRYPGKVFWYKAYRKWLVIYYDDITMKNRFVGYFTKQDEGYKAWKAEKQYITMLRRLSLEK